MIVGFVSGIAADKRRAKIIIIVAVVVVALIWIITSTGERGKQRELKRGFDNLLQADSYHANANLDLSLPVQLGDRERPIVGVTFGIDGDVMYQDEQPVLTGTINSEARGRGMILFADGDLRLFSDKVAFRLDNLPSLLNPTGTLVEKWTYVASPLLATNNVDDLKTALRNVLTEMNYVGQDTVPGTEDMALHFNRRITNEQEAILEEVFRHGVSGNQGLHVIARLLRAFDVKSLDVWVDGSEDELRLVQMMFVSADNEEFGATLSLAFSEYGKDVEFNVPEEEITVQPEVFGRIFGQGDLSSQ